MRTVTAEALKLATLPGTVIASALAIVCPVTLTLILTALHSAVSGRDQGFAELGLSVALAIAFGVLAVSSEYAVVRPDSQARQITSTLLALPQRRSLALTKLGVIAGWTCCLAVSSTALTLLVAHVRGGAHGGDALGWRVLGLVAYWVLSATIAAGATLVLRSGVLPLAVGIANSTLVSVSLLLSQVTSLAKFLPDAAGIAMFSRGFMITDHLSPGMGAIVMSGWAVGVAAIGVLAISRRDA